jgi:hypothetical protein
MASENPSEPGRRRGRATPSGVVPGRIGREAVDETGRGIHEPVSGSRRPGPAEELPPFDESRAIPAEDLSYGPRKNARSAPPEEEAESDGV